MLAEWPDAVLLLPHETVAWLSWKKFLAMLNVLWGWAHLAFILIMKYNPGWPELLSAASGGRASPRAQFTFLSRVFMRGRQQQCCFFSRQSFRGMALSNKKNKNPKPTAFDVLGFSPDTWSVWSTALYCFLHCFKGLICSCQCLLCGDVFFWKFIAI